MKRIILIHQSTVSRLKQRARRLKRAKDISHLEALEIVANAVGLDNWHQVSEAAKLCQPIQDAYSKGFVLAFDAKEAPDPDDEDSPLLWEEFAFDLLGSLFFEQYRNQPDEEDLEGRPISEMHDPDDLKQYFNSDWECMYFFRLKDPYQVTTVEQLLSLIHKYTFWPPRFIFAKGKLLDTYGLPALNDDREVIGIRF